MSVFRPSARLTAPDGREWELYAYRIALGERPGGDGGLDADLGGYDRFGALAGLLDGVLWLLGEALHLLALLVWEMPRAGLAALRSDEWTIEAVTWEPHRTSYAWKTTRQFRGHVLAQVEGRLARGEVPKVGHATYLGRTG